MAEHPHRTASHNRNGEAPAAYVTLILDETGSMQDCKGAAIAGVNEYLKSLRQGPTPVRFTLTLFNSGKLEVRHRNEPVALVPELTERTYQPAEGTPLYDAIGRTITAAGRDVSPEFKKLCVILTDGLENASREYTRDGIARMIKEYEGNGWTFVYLGADHDAWAAGGDIGLSGGNTISFCRQNTAQTFDRLAEATTAYLSAQPDELTQGFWNDAGAAPNNRADSNESARSSRGR
jgi:hypothetical protein